MPSYVACGQYKYIYIQQYLHKRIVWRGKSLSPSHPAWIRVRIRIRIRIGDWRNFRSPVIFAIFQLSVNLHFYLEEFVHSHLYALIYIFFLIYAYISLRFFSAPHLAAMGSFRVAWTFRRSICCQRLVWILIKSRWVMSMNKYVCM